CDALLAALDTDAAFGADLRDTTAIGAGAGDYLGTASGAVRREGGILCRWESVTPYADLQVIALPHAAESWEHYRNDLALFQPQQGTLGEHSYFGCIGDGCRADVLQG